MQNLIELPNNTEILNAWVNGKYLNDYKQKLLHENYCSDEPFKHVVMEDFFTPEALKILENVSEKVKLTPIKDDGHAKYTDWHAGPFFHKDFTIFMYSREFKDFLNSLLHEELIANSKSIPRLNIFMPSSKGVTPHTDSDYGKVERIVMIIQLSKESNGNGGDLVFYKKPGVGSKIIEFTRIKPIYNSLIIFKSSYNSYHSVTDMTGAWERRTISLGWYTKDGLIAERQEMKG